MKKTNRPVTIIIWFYQGPEHHAIGVVLFRLNALIPNSLRLSDALPAHRGRRLAEAGTDEVDNRFLQEGSGHSDAHSEPETNAAVSYVSRLIKRIRRLGVCFVEMFSGGGEVSAGVHGSACLLEKPHSFFAVMFAH
jgi:hypothetical protein